MRCQISIRRACRRRRVAAKPSKVAIRIRPACKCLLSLEGDRRLPRLLAGGAGGVCKIDLAVSFAAPIWSGLSGLALTATRRRLASEGKCGVFCLSLTAASPAQIAAIIASKAPTAPKAQNCP